MHVTASDLTKRLISKNLDPLKHNSYFQALLDGLHNHRSIDLL